MTPRPVADASAWEAWQALEMEWACPGCGGRHWPDAIHRRAWALYLVATGGTPRRCPKCGIVKTAEEGFTAATQRKAGGRCRACVAAYARKYKARRGEAS